MCLQGQLTSQVNEDMGASSSSLGSTTMSAFTWPPLRHLSARQLSSHSTYLLDAADHLYMWLGTRCSTSTVKKLFGTNKLPDQEELDRFVCFGLDFIHFTYALSVGVSGRISCPSGVRAGFHVRWGFGQDFFPIGRSRSISSPYCIG